MFSKGSYSVACFIYVVISGMFARSGYSSIFMKNAHYGVQLIKRTVKKRELWNFIQFLIIVIYSAFAF